MKIISPAMITSTTKIFYFRQFCGGHETQNEMKNPLKKIWFARQQMQRENRRNVLWLDEIKLNLYIASVRF